MVKEFFMESDFVVIWDLCMALVLHYETSNKRLSHKYVLCYTHYKGLHSNTLLLLWDVSLFNFFHPFASKIVVVSLFYAFICSWMQLISRKSHVFMKKSISFISFRSTSQYTYLWWEHNIEKETILRQCNFCFCIYI